MPIKDQECCEEQQALSAIKVVENEASRLRKEIQKIANETCFLKQDIIDAKNEFKKHVITGDQVKAGTYKRWDYILRENLVSSFKPYVPGSYSRIIREESLRYKSN